MEIHGIQVNPLSPQQVAALRELEEEVPDLFDYMKSWPDAEATAGEYVVVRLNDPEPAAWAFGPTGPTRFIYGIWAPGRAYRNAYGVLERQLVNGNVVGAGNTDMTFFDQEVAEDFAAMLNFIRRFRQNGGHVSPVSPMSEDRRRREPARRIRLDA